MKNYILLSIQIAALVMVSNALQIEASMAMQIINIILISTNIIGICFHIHNIIIDVIDKRIVEHIINEHIKRKQTFWHDLKENPSDVPKGEDIHRKILLQDRYGDIYTGNYYPKDDCHPEDCFSVEYLEHGFQGCNFVAFEQIAKWAEFKE